MEPTGAAPPRHPALKAGLLLVATGAALGIGAFLHVPLGTGLLAVAGMGAWVVLPRQTNPLTAKKLTRFRAIKRGYWSFVFLAAVTVWSLFAELFINDRALIVHYEGTWHFPTYGAVQRGDTYGLTGTAAFTPVDYRELDARWEAEGSANWILIPLVPYGPNESIPFEGVIKPRPPSAEVGHYLGTDRTGRDILARLVYGFRIAIFFALAFTVLTFQVGIVLGCLMGYFGGWFDLLVQRLIEIWSNIPFLYMVIIVFSIIPTAFTATVRILLLLIIVVLFSWVSMTYFMRTATYKEKARDYTAAALVLGAGPWRVIFHHILPNAVSTIVTFIPFTVVAAITAITALDFLGFGLPPPTPSLGEMLQQGRDLITTAPWIITSAITFLTVLLTLITFVGEAIREAFDPRQFTTYA